MFENLDRILISTEWEINHPLSTVVVLLRVISDHTPLLIDTGKSSLSNNVPMFKFELGWLLRDAFMDMVSVFWKCMGMGWQDEVLVDEN
jgi:branched-subunit amino acid permease